MASIQQRVRSDGTIAHRVMFRIDRSLTSETFDDPKTAADFAALVDRIGGQAAREVRDARDGNHGATPTLSQYARDYVTNRAGISTGTRSDYLRIIDRDIDDTIIGSLPVDAITPRHIAAWVREQEAKGLSAKTIRNRHGLLYAVFRNATKPPALRPDNPCEHTRISPTARKGMTFLTKGEFAVLLACVPAHYQPLTAVLAGTGLRFGEATALQVGDVHLDDEPPVVHVERAWKWTDNHGHELGPPKTRKGRRVVSLAEQLTGLLRPLLEDRKPAELVFTTPTGQRVRNITFREDAWLPALQKAKLGKRPRIHDLRHTYASWQIAAGVPLPVIQQQLGHESVKTTVDVYGHLAHGALALAAQASSLALAQALPELEG